MGCFASKNEKAVDELEKKGDTKPKIAAQNCKNDSSEEDGDSSSDSDVDQFAATMKAMPKKTSDEFGNIVF